MTAPRSTADSVQFARALLSRSLVALGISNANGNVVRDIRGFEITLESRPARGNPNQARRWSDSTPFPVPTTLRYLVDHSARRVLHELRSPAPGDIWFNYLTRYDTTGAWQIDLLRWRLGTDILRNPAASALVPLGAAERQLPHVVVQHALASPALRYTGPRASGGRQLETIEFTDPRAGGLMRLDLDATTMLPALITGSGTNPATIELLDYRTVDGVRVAYRRLQRAGDALVNEQRVVALDLKPRLDDARFAIPTGYADAPPAGSSRATPVAGAVYRLDGMPGGYHAAFVVGESGVMVLEAPQTPAFSDAAFRVIEATAPGKPVTHVFVTHHHADHVGGLGPYVARGATVVVGAGHEEAVRRQLPDSLRAKARFETVSERRVFGAGASRVEAFPVPNEHVDGNVAYFVPDARVLFQGDLFYIPERGPIPRQFLVTDALLRALRTNSMVPEHVIGVHGRTGSWAEFEASLRLERQRAP
jgi:glyoxylase-like metal-dependent hydrolase (beta-lactamase superfamily II)